MSKKIADPYKILESVDYNIQQPVIADDWKDLFSHQNFIASRIGTRFGGFVWDPKIDGNGSGDQRGIGDVNLCGRFQKIIDGTGGVLEVNLYGKQITLSVTVRNEHQDLQVASFNVNQGTSTLGWAENGTSINVKDLTRDGTESGDLALMSIEFSASDNGGTWELEQIDAWERPSTSGELVYKRSSFKYNPMVSFYGGDNIELNTLKNGTFEHDTNVGSSGLTFADVNSTNVGATTNISFGDSEILKTSRISVGGSETLNETVNTFDSNDSVHATQILKDSNDDQWIIASRFDPSDGADDTSTEELLEFRKTSGSWSNGTLLETSAWGAGIAATIDDNDDIHIVYAQGFERIRDGEASFGDVKYKRYDNSSDTWTDEITLWSTSGTTTVEVKDIACAIDVDNDDGKDPHTAHIFFQELDDLEWRYAETRQADINVYEYIQESNAASPLYSSGRSIFMELIKFPVFDDNDFPEIDDEEGTVYLFSHLGGDYLEYIKRDTSKSNNWTTKNLIKQTDSPASNYGDGMEAKVAGDANIKIAAGMFHSDTSENQIHFFDWDPRDETYTEFKGSSYTNKENPIGLGIIQNDV